MSLNKLFGAIILAALCFLLVMLREINRNNKPPDTPPPPVAWYQTQIEVTYLKEGKDTFDLEVSEIRQSILIDNGNISYWRADKQRTGTTSRITICSYARTFKILSSEKQIVNE